MFSSGIQRNIPQTDISYILPISKPSTYTKLCIFISWESVNISLNLVKKYTGRSEQALQLGIHEALRWVQYICICEWNGDVYGRTLCTY
jgi:hypothetical protein